MISYGSTPQKINVLDKKRSANVAAKELKLKQRKHGRASTLHNAE
jgi:hypothetical protein